MPLVITNVMLSGSGRRETVGSIDYYVVPVSMIVPGILNGSDGPILYAAEEISRFPDDWNGIPVVLEHPRQNGELVSARDPSILERSGVGTIYRAKYDGKLVAEAWIDLTKLRQSNAELTQQLLKGTPIEVSTGLFSDKLPAPENAKFNGEVYNAIVKQIRPDHLAILTSGKGACSIQDGCGLNVNKNEFVTNKSVGDTKMAKRTQVQRDKILTNMTANCSCEKLKAKRKDILTKIMNQTDGEIPEGMEPSDTLTAEECAAFMEAEIQRRIDEKELAVVTTETPDASKQGQNNTNDTAKQVVQTTKTTYNSFHDALSTFGTPEEKAVWNDAVRQRENEKLTLIQKIVGNMSGSAVEKDAKAKSLAQRSLDDLRELVSFIPISEPTINHTNGYQNGNGFVPSYLGAQGSAPVLAPLETPMPKKEIDWKSASQKRN